jgi:excisionase family DNA binding protein
MRKSEAKPQKEKSIRGELMTVEEVSKKTRLSKEWIYKHMKNGTLPFPWFMPSPGKRLIDSADVEDWQQSTKIPAGVIPGSV